LTRHTIVIDVPDHDKVPGCEVEAIATRALETAQLSYGALLVVEYHHEQMTESSEARRSIPIVGLGTHAIRRSARR
jgi:hypothetical protein